MENRKRYLITYLVLTILLAALLLLNIRSGSVELTGRQVLAALFGNTADSPILREIRMPRAIADALLGEVTPVMAEAVGRSGAVRILLPSDKCDTLIAGIGGQGMSALIADAMDKLGVVLAQKTTQEG